MIIRFKSNVCYSVTIVLTSSSAMSWKVIRLVTSLMVLTKLRDWLRVIPRKIWCVQIIIFRFLNEFKAYIYNMTFYLLLLQIYCFVILLPYQNTQNVQVPMKLMDTSREHYYCKWTIIVLMCNIFSPWDKEKLGGMTQIDLLMNFGIVHRKYLLILTPSV